MKNYDMTQQKKKKAAVACTHGWMLFFTYGPTHSESD